eukprot:COSAG04_NODE_1045_length_8578_cov_9.398396_11_plen_127_part_00
MAETSAGFEALAEAVAGSLGGFISSAVLFPLDFVKTQQQAGTVKGSFLSVGAVILKERGPLAFYRGAHFRGFQSVRPRPARSPHSAAAAPALTAQRRCSLSCRATRRSSTSTCSRSCEMPTRRATA